MSHGVRYYSFTPNGTASAPPAQPAAGAGSLAALQSQVLSSDTLWPLVRDHILQQMTTEMS